MPDGIDAGVDDVEAPTRDAMSDRSPSDPGRGQLSPGNDAVLRRGEPGNPPVNRTNRTNRTNRANPIFGTYLVLEVGLVGHGARLTAGDARVARTAWRLCGDCVTAAWRDAGDDDAPSALCR